MEQLGFLHRGAVRRGWGGNNDRMDGQVQVNETYVGGREKNKLASKKRNAARGAVSKVAVIGMHDQSGQVCAKSVKSTDAVNLVGFMQENAPEGGEVATGEFRADTKGFTHKTAHHSAGEYVSQMARTNGIANFWSLVKLGYISA